MSSQFTVLLTAQRACRHARYFFGKSAQKHAPLAATQSWIFPKYQDWNKNRYGTPRPHFRFAMSVRGQHRVVFRDRLQNTE